MKDRLLKERLLLTLVIGRQDAPGKDIRDIALAAFKGGATALQLREKTLSDRELYEDALSLATLARELGRLFIVNNRVDIALAVDADGVHLGEEDLPLEAARGMLPRGCVLGFSASSKEKGAEAILKGADYLGVGALYPSPSKPEAPVLAANEVGPIISLKWPTVGIGGISLANAQDAWAMGFTGLAVISAIAQAGDPEGAARELISLRPKAKA